MMYYTDLHRYIVETLNRNIKGLNGERTILNDALKTLEVGIKYENNLSRRQPSVTYRFISN